MTLSVGAQIGSYEILAPLGAGGMGEVYRASDTRLNRQVALKVLPELFALDPDRLARFRREAQVLASLNHPNIAAIHGLEEADGVQALVLELVEGPTLADRIAQGPIPLDEALPIARQIVSALEAAHERAVIHRDLKPANIKMRPDGTIKVLDFGLAKAIAEQRPGDMSDGTIANSPTLSLAMSAAGIILGTAAYMAPEQARGRPCDQRADIWAFGVVLYEMVTGEQLFQGETISDTLAQVLTKQPDLTRVPVEVRRLLSVCLERDPKQRLRAISDAPLLLEGAQSAATISARRTRPGRLLPWAIAVLGVIAASALAFIHFRETPPAEERSVRFQIQPPENSTATFFRLSPDGRTLAIVIEEMGRSRLWVRRLDSLAAQPLPGTEGAGFPFWSPDNAFIGFSADGRLKKVAVTGGPPQTLCEAPTGARGTWGNDAVIVFATAGGLMRVSAAGGTPAAITTPAAGENHFVPQFLPDGRRFLYTITGANAEANGVHVGTLNGTPSIRILADVTAAAFVPGIAGRNGHLLFRRERTLMAQPFDADQLQMTGEMFPLVENVGTFGSPTHGAFTVSENGVLAFSAPQQLTRELVWVNQTGKQIELAGPPSVYSNISLSPDGKKIAFDRGEASPSDIWVLDLARGVPTRLTFDPYVDNLPIWSPDGLRVLFASRRTGAFHLYIKAATGAGQENVLIEIGTPSGWATDWSRDGRFILYRRPGEKTGADLWIAAQSGDRPPFPYLQSPFEEWEGRFSPDAQWIAYVSNESGRDEVYVQTFPLSSEKRRISTNGGYDPQWRADGTALFYLSGDRNLMAVAINRSGTTFEAGVPKRLFAVPGNLTRRSYAVADNGRRFLVSRPAADTTAGSITVVSNWQASLGK